MRKSIYIIMLILFLLSITSVNAWTSYTHNWICDKAGLSELDCASADKPATQSKYHDISPVNHHCANNASDCNARKIADKYASMIDVDINITNITDARGFAAHLYADSMVPAHWYSTDYNTCHKIFEDKVEEKLKEADNVKYTIFRSTTDLSKWNITMRCLAKFGKENRTIELYADNAYMDYVAMYVAEKMNVIPVVQTVKEYDLTPILYVILAFLIVVFVLFIIYGLEQSHYSRR
jgi:hypothetical protein